MRRWPAVSILDAYGPEREHEPIKVGDRVECWAGLGIVLSIGPAFNGVQGIHAYAGIELDSGNRCSAKLDALHLAEPAIWSEPLLEGALF